MAGNLELTGRTIKAFDFRSEVLKAKGSRACTSRAKTRARGASPDKKPSLGSRHSSETSSGHT